MQLDLITKLDLKGVTDQIQELKQTIEELKVRDFKESIYSPQQAAKLLKISSRTLTDMRTRKDISFSQYGRKIWFRGNDIIEFLNKMKIYKK